MKPTHGDFTGKSCSCTSCTYNTTSQSDRPSVLRIVKLGSKIDKLYYGKYIPLRERKLMEKLVRTRAVYDDIRSQLLSDSNISFSENADLRPVNQVSPKLRRKDIDEIEKSSGILELVSLVDKGATIGPKKDGECCSCCSCGSKIHVHEHAAGVQHRHRHSRVSSRLSMISGHKRLRDGHRLGKHVRIKAKYIRSDPCMCTIKFSGLLKRESKALFRKLRPKQPEPVIEPYAAVDKKNEVKGHAIVKKLKDSGMGEAARKSMMKIRSIEKIRDTERKAKIKVGKPIRKVKPSKHLQDLMTAKEMEYLERINAVSDIGKISKTKIKTKIESSARKSLERMKNAEHKAMLKVEILKKAIRESKALKPRNEVEYVEARDNTFRKRKDSIIKYKKDFERKKLLEDWACAFGCDAEECEPEVCYEIIKQRTLRKGPNPETLSDSSIGIQANRKENPVTTTETQYIQRHKQTTKQEAITPKDINEKPKLDHTPTGVEPYFSPNVKFYKNKAARKIAGGKNQIKIRQKTQGKRKVNQSRYIASSTSQSVGKGNESGGLALRRCFCTLKLKPKIHKTHQKASESFSKRLQIPPLRWPLLPYECEPMVCIPGECDPFECYKKIEKRNIKYKSARTDVKYPNRTSRSTQSLTSTEVSRINSKIPHTKTQERIELVKPQRQNKKNIGNEGVASGRQVVRIGSKISFKIELYKEKEEDRKLELNDTDARPPPKMKNKYLRHKSVNKSRPNFDHNTSQTSTSEKLKNTMTKHQLRRCFCTLKLAKPAGKKHVKAFSQHTMTSRESEPNTERELKVTNIGTEKEDTYHAKYKLLPYECEPGICVSDPCNPYECQKIMKMRNTKQGSKRVGTENRKKSTYSITKKFISSKARQSIPVTRKGIIWQKKDEHGSQSQFNKGKQKPTSVDEEKKKSGVLINTKIKRCFCTLKLHKFGKIKKNYRGTESAILKQDMNQTVAMATKSTKTKRKRSAPRLLLEPYECEPYFCIPGECDPYQCVERVKLRQKSKPKVIGTAVSKIKMKSVSSVTTKAHENVLTQSNIKEETTHVKKKRRRSKYTALSHNPNTASKAMHDTASRSVFGISSNFSFNIEFSTDRPSNSSETSDQRPPKVLKNKGDGPNKIASKESESQSIKIRQLNKAAGIEPMLKRCFCTLKLHNKTGNKKRKNYTFDRPVNAAVMLAQVNNNPTKLLRKSNFKNKPYNENWMHNISVSSKSSSTISLNKKEAQLYPYNNKQSRSSFIYVADKTLPIDLNLITRELIQTNTLMKSSFYAMNVQVHNKGYKLKPYECEPGVCVPGECDPYKCRKLIMKRLRRKASTMTTEQTFKSNSSETPSYLSTKQQQFNKGFDAKPRNNEKHRGMKYETLPRAQKYAVRINSALNTSIEFSKSSVHESSKKRASNDTTIKHKTMKTKETLGSTTEKLINRRTQSATTLHHKGSYVTSKSKRCFCTLKLQKQGKPPKSEKRKSKHVIKTMDAGQNTPKIKNYILDLDPNECEPNVCLPGNCDPYVCLERIKRRHLKHNIGATAKPQRVSMGSMTSSITRNTKGKHVQQREKVNKRETLNKPTLDNKNELLPHARIGSSISFKLEFYKDGNNEVANVSPRSEQMENTQKHITVKSKEQATQDDLNSRRHQNAQAKIDMKNRFSKTSSLIKRCFCTLKLRYRDRVKTSKIEGTHNPVEGSPSFLNKSFSVLKSIKSFKPIHKQREVKHSGKRAATTYAQTDKIKEKPQYQYNKVEAYECEPGICVPGQCDPYVCDEIMKKRKFKEKISSTEGPDTKSISTFYTSSKNTKSTGSNICSPKHKNDHKTREDHIRKSASSDKNVVRIGSNINFSIEFYKESFPMTNTVKLAAKEIKEKKDSQRVHYKEKNLDTSVSLNTRESQVDAVRKEQKSSAISPILKRCFCTLALSKQEDEKKKHKGIKLEKTSRGTKSPAFEMTPNFIEAYSNTRPYKLEPYECEPNVCVPGQCNPYKCEKLIKKRLLKESGTSPEKRKVKNTTSIAKHEKKLKEQYSQSMGITNSLEKREQYVESSGDHNRQVVRIGSSISFNIEFSKDNSQSPNAAGLESAKHVQHYSKSISRKHESVPRKEVKLVNSPSQFDRKRTESTASGVGPLIKKCFCTLKLQKLGKHNKIKLETNQKSKDTSVPTKNIHREVDVTSLHKKVGTKTKRYLELYECEPGVCVPGMCNPTECQERIKLRNLKEQGTGTKPRFERSVSSVTYKSNPHKKKKQQSGPRPRVKRQTDNHSTREKRIKDSNATSIHNRQTVRIGSSFNFNIEFSKQQSPKYLQRSNENLQRETQSIKPIKTTNQSTRGTVPLKRNKLQQVRTTSEDKGSGIGPILKRCFCTLALHDAEKKTVSNVKHKLDAKNKSTMSNMKHKPTEVYYQSKSTSTKYKRKSIKKVPVIKLAPYECEPGLCVPGQCDPYECLERLKRRGHKSKTVGTTRRLSQASVASLVTMTRPAYKCQRVQSHAAKHIVEEPRFPMKSPKKQVAKFGSNFSFNIEFYKENLYPNDLLKRDNGDAFQMHDQNCEGYKAKKKKIARTNTQCPRINCQIQAIEPTNNKSSMAGKALKRCFCTARLHQSGIENMKKRRSKAKITTVGRVDEIITSSPFKPTTYCVQYHAPNSPSKKKTSTQCEPGCFCTNKETKSASTRVNEKHTHKETTVPNKMETILRFTPKKFNKNKSKTLLESNINQARGNCSSVCSCSTKVSNKIVKTSKRLTVKEKKIHISRQPSSKRFLCSWFQRQSKSKNDENSQINIGKPHTDSIKKYNTQCEPGCFCTNKETKTASTRVNEKHTQKETSVPNKMETILPFTPKESNKNKSKTLLKSNVNRARCNCSFVCSCSTKLSNKSAKPSKQLSVNEEKIYISRQPSSKRFLCSWFKKQSKSKNEKNSQNHIGKLHTDSIKKYNTQSEPGCFCTNKETKTASTRVNEKYTPKETSVPNKMETILPATPKKFNKNKSKPLLKSSVNQAHYNCCSVCSCGTKLSNKRVKHSKSLTVKEEKKHISRQPASKRFFCSWFQRKSKIKNEENSQNNDGKPHTDSIKKYRTILPSTPKKLNKNKSKPIIKSNVNKNLYNCCPVCSCSTKLSNKSVIHSKRLTFKKENNHIPHTDTLKKSKSERCPQKLQPQPKKSKSVKVSRDLNIEVIGRSRIKKETGLTVCNKKYCYLQCGDADLRSPKVPIDKKHQPLNNNSGNKSVKFTLNHVVADKTTKNNSPMPATLNRERKSCVCDTQIKGETRVSCCTSLLKRLCMRMKSKPKVTTVVRVSGIDVNCLFSREKTVATGDSKKMKKSNQFGNHRSFHADSAYPKDLASNVKTHAKSCPCCVCKKNYSPGVTLKKQGTHNKLINLKNKGGKERIKRQISKPGKNFKLCKCVHGKDGKSPKSGERKDIKISRKPCVCGSSICQKKDKTPKSKMRKLHKPCICGSRTCARELAKVERKKRIEKISKKPCVCGSSICPKIDKEPKYKMKKLHKPCICGSRACARFLAKVERKKILEEAKKMKINNKIKKKRQLRDMKLFKARHKISQKEDKNRMIKRRKNDKMMMSHVKQYKDDTSDIQLAAESIFDIAKLGYNTVTGVGRSTFRTFTNPKHTYQNIKACAVDPSRACRSCKTALNDSGVASTLNRVKMRLGSMKRVRNLKNKLEGYAVTSYFIHMADKDPKKRLKRPKKVKKREVLDYGCSLYMGSLRKRPWLAVYHMCPWFYPHCMSLLNVWKQFTDIFLFLLAVVVWSPCIFCMEACRAMMCCMLCTG